MGFEDPNSCTHTSGYVTTQDHRRGTTQVRGRMEELKVRISNFQWFENICLSMGQFEMVWAFRPCLVIIGWIHFLFSSSKLIFCFSNLVFIFSIQPISCLALFSSLVFVFSFFFTLYFSIKNSTQLRESFYFYFSWDKSILEGSTDLVFYTKCHCIHFQENEHAKKLHSIFVFKSYFLDTENENWIQIQS